MDNSKRVSRAIRARAAIWSLVGVLFASAGCHSLPMPASDPFAMISKSSATQAAPATGQQADMIQVEFRTEESKPERRMVALNGEMHVQDAMQQANGFRRYSRAKIELVRKTPTGNSHKMDVSYDRSSHKIDPQTDYHLRPGDILIVTEDPSGIFGDMLKGVGFPVGSPAARHLISG